MRGIIAVLLAGVLVAGGCAGVNDTGEENAAGPAAPSNAGLREGSGAGDGSGRGPGTGDGGGPQSVLIELKVAVDESLAEAFAQVEHGFEVNHPNVEVVLSYGEGSNLADRIAGGEPADVFVTDDPFAARAVTLNAEPVEVGRVSLVLVKPGAGAGFIDFVRAGDGRRILTDSGLLRP
ncbi:substrate-binding domain-containing protein [Actinoplanes sp. NPDC026670]|uniref:molybdate ABC transporter substrate-binding protein n=1 Tax=Actinoplanes sp. NPDC026670 TaxID=3154700 RepID=UPI0033DB81F0